VRQGIALPTDDVPAQRDFFLIETPVPDLSAFVDKFDHIHKIFADLSVLEAITEEVIEDKFNEGVVMFEMRWAPSYISGSFEYDFNDILRYIQRGVAKGRAKCDNKIEVGMICIAVGALGAEQFKKTADFCIANKDAFIAFDIAGNEVNAGQYKEYMDQLHAAGVNITVHAAEDRVAGKPENAIIAVEDLHATRIGHGIQTEKDPAAFKTILDRDIHLELCPSSNYVTNSVDSVADHPIRRFFDLGANISLNTDDPGLMAVDLPHEYKLLHELPSLHFTPAEFKDMNLKAIEASFMPKHIKDKVRDTWFSHKDPLGIAVPLPDLQPAKQVAAAAVAAAVATAAAPAAQPSVQQKKERKTRIAEDVLSPVEGMQPERKKEGRRCCCF